MAFFTFNGSAAQNQQARQLKNSLIVAKELAERVQAQTAQMTLAQAQEQFGLPASGITLAQWQTTIDNIVAALNSASVTAYTDQVGFST